MGLFKDKILINKVRDIRDMASSLNFEISNLKDSLLRLQMQVLRLQAREAALMKYLKLKTIDVASVESKFIVKKV